MMQLSSKTKYTIAGVAIAVAFATGRYTVQSPTIKTIETDQSKINLNQDKDTHTITTKTTIKTPDGTVKTVEATDTTIAAKVTEVATTNTTLEQTITPPKTNTLNVSALIGNDFSVGLLKPIYGASVTKQILGPVTAGAYGMSNGLVGISIGLNF